MRKGNQGRRFPERQTTLESVRRRDAQEAMPLRACSGIIKLGQDVGGARLTGGRGLYCPPRRACREPRPQDGVLLTVGCGAAEADPARQGGGSGGAGVSRAGVGV